MCGSEEASLPQALPDPHSAPRPQLDTAGEGHFSAQEGQEHPGAQKGPQGPPKPSAGNGAAAPQPPQGMGALWHSQDGTQSPAVSPLESNNTIPALPQPRLDPRRKKAPSGTRCVPETLTMSRPSSVATLGPCAGLPVSPWVPQCPPVPRCPPGAVPAHRGPSARPGPSAPPAASAAPSPGHARPPAHARARGATAGRAGRASPAPPDYSSHGAARPRPAPPGGRGGPDGEGSGRAPGRGGGTGSGGARGTRRSPAEPRLSSPSAASLGSGRRRTPPSPRAGLQRPRALHLPPHSVPAALVPCPPIAADGGYRSVRCPTVSE